MSSKRKGRIGRGSVYMRAINWKYRPVMYLYNRMFPAGHQPNMPFFTQRCVFEPYETFKMKLFARIGNDFESLFILGNKYPNYLFDRFLSMPHRPV